MQPEQSKVTIRNRNKVRIGNSSLNFTPLAVRLGTKFLKDHEPTANGTAYLTDYYLNKIIIYNLKSM